MTAAAAPAATVAPRPARHASIRNRILLSFGAVLLVLFLLLLVAFRWVVRTYVAGEADSQLREAVRASLYQDVPPRPGFPRNPFENLPELPELTPEEYPLLERFVQDRIRRATLASDVEGLWLSADGTLLWPREGDPSYPPGSTMDVLLAGLQTDALPDPWSEARPVPPTRMELSAGTYYFLRIPAFPSGGAGDILLYLKADRYLALGRTINVVLLSVLAFALGLTILLVYVLSERIVRPIRQLRDFVSVIGRGRIQPREFTFRDRELAELATHVNDMARRIDQNDRDQRTFFQNASHELRTPLMSIQGYAEGIRYQVFDPPDEAADVILAETRRLTDMVEDLLTLSRIDSQATLQKAEILDLREILSRAVEAVRGMAFGEHKRIDLEVPASTVPVKCDESALHRAFSNVISNGVRYASSCVRIQLDTDADGLRVTVEDDGPGIAPADMDRIFDRFYKGPGGKHGIGLAIARAVLEHHKGTLAAENLPAGGARFVFRLRHPEA